MLMLFSVLLFQMVITVKTADILSNSWSCYINVQNCQNVAQTSEIIKAIQKWQNSKKLGNCVNGQRFVKKKTYCQNCINNQNCQNGKNCVNDQKTIKMENMSKQLKLQLVKVTRTVKMANAVKISKLSICGKHLKPLKLSPKQQKCGQNDQNCPTAKTKLPKGFNLSKRKQLLKQWQLSKW